jgi:hypothetical protein
VEPLTALMMIGGSYGANALVKTLGGSTDLSSLAGDLVKALAETESKIDERLTGIELKLDELLEQRYTVAVHTGVRYLLDAIPAQKKSRRHDLDRARNSFIEAQSAARSYLQKAIAERYLLLCFLGLKRTELVGPALARVEGLAMTAAFEAMVLTEHNRKQAGALMRHEGSSLRHLADRDRRHRAQLQVKSAALDTICISGRLLGEAAMLGQVIGLPPGVAPPPEAIHDPILVEEPRSAIGRRLTTPALPMLPDKGYWTFTIKAGETLRIGPLTVQNFPGLSEGQKFSKQLDQIMRKQWKRPDQILSEERYVRLDLACPLPTALRVEVNTTGRRAPDINPIRSDKDPFKEITISGKPEWSYDLEQTQGRSATTLHSNETWTEVSIPPPKPGSSPPLLTISPRDVFRNLIEVTFIT